MAPESNDACKVDRVSARWSLSGIDDRLRERFEDGESLRDLETYYNEAVLRAAMESAGMETIDGEVSNLYRLLTDDAVSAGGRVDAASRLERNGVDRASLVDDFVSYGTIRTHLSDCLDVRTGRDETVTVDGERTTVLKLVSRTESVAGRTVERLAERTGLTIPAPSVTVSVRVACLECNSEYSFTGLLDRGGCSCESD